MIQADKLKAFRQEAYQHLTRAKDATFELTDAILLTPESLLFSRPIIITSISTLRARVFMKPYKIVDRSATS